MPVMRCAMPADNQGFSRIDLVALAATAALFAVLLLPVLGDSERHNRAAVCSANLKNLVRGWSAFAADHADALPFNANAPDGQYDWCGGSWLDLFPTNPNNWNHELYTKRAQLWPYVLDTAAFTCPDDPTRARATSGPDAGRFIPRIRSYAMNNWIGGAAWGGNTGWTVYTNLTQVTAAGPDRLWILLDEHPDSINDGFFVVDMTGYPNASGQARMVDFPTYYHGRGAAFGFADGRAEVRLWKDNRTVPLGTLGLNSPQPNNPDIIWLQERSTRRSN